MMKAVVTTTLNGNQYRVAVVIDGKLTADATATPGQILDVRNGILARLSSEPGVTSVEANAIPSIPGHTHKTDGERMGRRIGGARC